jgi:hypothetical protein
MTYDPQKITNHADQGVDKFLEQFKGEPALDALARSYLNRIQELEDAIWEVILIRGIDASEGVGLDAIGNIVGRKRLGLGDIDYRVALKAQIRINRSSGTPEDMIAVTALSVSPVQDFTYQEAYPATVVIEALGAMTFSILVLFDNLLRTKPGGVRLLLEYSEAALDASFTFSDDDTTMTDTGKGWGDDTDPLTGGVFIDVLGS